MKIFLAFQCLFVSLTAFAEVNGLHCEVSHVNQAIQSQDNRFFNIPYHSSPRKITFMVSETSADHMATYNTTVNILAKADENGLKVVSVKAWPDGGAAVSRGSQNEFTVSFPSRLDRHEIEAAVSCEKFNADYLLVSQFTFKDEDYLNIPGLAFESLFELASNENSASYARSVAKVNSHSEFAAKEFCFVGNVEKLMSDLKRSVYNQVHNDDRPGTYPNYWERSGYTGKTLAPTNLTYSQTLKQISWSQPRETQTCVRSHHETVNNSDTGMDEDVEICDEWAPQKLSDQTNQIKNCNF